jgi:hypothetical protein
MAVSFIGGGNGVPRENHKSLTNFITRFYEGLVWFMVFNATFNNISVISWRSVLLVVETEVSKENH